PPSLISLIYQYSLPCLDEIATQLNRILDIQKTTRFSSKTMGSPFQNESILGYFDPKPVRLSVEQVQTWQEALTSPFLWFPRIEWHTVSRRPHPVNVQALDEALEEEKYLTQVSLDQISRGNYRAALVDRPFGYFLLDAPSIKRCIDYAHSLGVYEAQQSRWNNLFGR